MAVQDCTCDDWIKNIDLITSGFILSHVHGMGGYTGKPFVH
jgi:hypothetical protein